MRIPEKPTGAIWTDDQWKAIHAKGSDILVAAAAGSGKTAVLVERIIQRVLDEENPINVDELLVATFTNASAAEMRHRIGVALEKEIGTNPHSGHLRRQLNLLNHATISTLHSFCLEVVRKYYYLIDIDPGFRILDETEGMLLRDEAMETLLEEEYGKEGNESFFRVVDMFTNDRSDDALQNLIFKLYDFSKANPNPNKWLDEVVANYHVKAGQSIEELPFIEPLLYDIRIQLDEAKRLFEQGLELTKVPGGPHKRVDNFLNDLSIVEAMHVALNESFLALYDIFQNYKFTTLKPCKGDEFISEYVEASKKVRDEGKAIVQKLKEELFSRKPETYLKDIQEMQQPVQVLVNLVRSFSVKFDELKKERAVADFSDLEHDALKILGKVDEFGNIIPTEAAQTYQKQFKEVYIDEYQDTNMVQETILQLVKQPTEANGNLFMVGDVKQSIYRFRLAEPNLFLKKYLRFSRDGVDNGLRIDLAQNFRSRKEVLDATNFLFKQIMGMRVGEIEYDEAAELKKGASYPESQPFPVELTILYKEDCDSDSTQLQNKQDEIQEETNTFTAEELEQSEMESRFVAKKIREFIDSGKEVYDTKKKMYRPIQYRDIVILFRSFTWAPQFMEALKDYGIPSYAEVSGGYFEAAEVSTMLALLKVIDNPYQDIPLVALFRSPIFGLNEEELARIRVEDRKANFYTASKKFLKNKANNEMEEKVQKKLSLFFSQLEEWRSLARLGSLSELIWQLYRDTNFYDYVGGLPGGRQRQANLRALYDRARQYESTSFRGLFRFLRFIERMQDRGEDLGVARSLGEKEDVVRIMTIHSSKGLEFPIVFIAGLARKFNMVDLYKSYLFDKENGFATNYVNPEKQITYPSLFHMALQRKKRLELVSEEMRVLYVALTRAKEKLYLIASTKSRDKLTKKWQKHLDHDEWLLNDFDRIKSNSYLDWIGPALIRHRDSDELRLSPLVIGNKKQLMEIANHPSEWQIQWISSHDMVQTEEEIDNINNYLVYVKEGNPVPVESEYKTIINNQLNWEYSYKLATIHRSKQSVSEIKRLKEVRDEYSGEDLIRSFKKPITERPKFLQEQTLTPAEKGTAMHLMMQHIRLDEGIPTKQSLENQVFLMQEKELLTVEEANSIDIEEIYLFFHTDLGRRLLSANWVKREVPFSFVVPTGEIYKDWQNGDDPVFIQGIIDCLFKDDSGLVLIDYKTDQITARFKNGFAEAQQILLNRYKTQIDLYRRAVETILHEKVANAYLFFFDGGSILHVD